MLCSFCTALFLLRFRCESNPTPPQQRRRQNHGSNHDIGKNTVTKCNENNGTGIATDNNNSAGARQDPASEEADERFVASLSACLEEMDATAAAAVDEALGGAMGGAAHMGGSDGRVLSGDVSGLGGLVVLVGSAASLERVPALVRRCFTHEVRPLHLDGVGMNILRPNRARMLRVLCALRVTEDIRDSEHVSESCE